LKKSWILSLKYVVYIESLVLLNLIMPNIKWKIEFEWRDKEYKWDFWWQWWDNRIDTALKELSKVLQSPDWKYWYYWEFDFIDERGNISHRDPSRWSWKVTLKVFENADENKIKEILDKSAKVLELMRASREQIAKILDRKSDELNNKIISGKTVRQWATECYSPEKLKNFLYWFKGTHTRFGEDHKIHVVDFDDTVDEWTFQAYRDDFERWCNYCR